MLENLQTNMACRLEKVLSFIEKSLCKIVKCPGLLFYTSLFFWMVNFSPPSM